MKESASPRPLHGGPVSPWPRRMRRLMHGYIAFVYTCVLIAVVSGIALTGSIALGAMPISLALLVSAVVLYTTTGLRPLTVAFASATMLNLFVFQSDATRLEVERNMSAIAAAIVAIIQ